MNNNNIDLPMDSKFKIGDKVRVKLFKNIEDKGGFVPYMFDYCGKEYTIDYIDKFFIDGTIAYLLSSDTEEIIWKWKEEWLEEIGGE